MDVWEALSWLKIGFHNSRVVIDTDDQLAHQALEGNVSKILILTLLFMIWFHQKPVVENLPETIVWKQNEKVLSWYVYAAILGDPMPKISGITKLEVSIAEADCRDCIVACRIFGEGCFCGEPFFVAKDPNNPEADEDDGYVVSYVHNEKTGESMFLVMDAKSPNLDTVVAVKLPRRVPYGFHGLFVRESDLNKL
ncbi:hypothetical protein RND71_016136 [Anisodus tanguticus]|uniref:Carotenoid cleavage dioxygenase n=1 Tax=Anisodus tanguticus TaxID=243964 RepID=A0AAE1VCF2_9SOLA|nr:hypothetical protein RND71_016136 [Anisodus tanguticus]